MGTLLTGILVVENATSVDGLPSSLQLDGLMWLGEKRILNGMFRYFNKNNYSFEGGAPFFAWIYVSSFSFLLFSFTDNLCRC
jgi:hypothetical protein